MADSKLSDSIPRCEFLDLLRRLEDLEPDDPERYQILVETVRTALLLRVRRGSENNTRRWRGSIHRLARGPAFLAPGNV
jgi:hypothetical protein